jgi:hypothetical protein
MEEQEISLKKNYMKKLYLFLSLVCISSVSGFMQDCTSSIDQNAPLLGFNPNPLPICYAGIDYNHINTIVLPGAVDNSLTPAPGDSIALCGVRILSVEIDTIFSTPYPASLNFTWEVWQNNVQVDTGEVINIDTATSVTRACMRIKVLNPPVPLSSQDVLVLQIKARGMINLGTCFDVPGTSGEASYQITFLLEPNTVSLNENHPNIMGSFTYPNPFTEYVRIADEFAQGETNQLTIFDLQGKVVKQLNVQGNQTVLMNELTNGVYVAKLTTAKGVFTQKIVK